MGHLAFHWHRSRNLCPLNLCRGTPAPRSQRPAARRVLFPTALVLQVLQKPFATNCHPNKEYSTTVTRTVPTRIVGAKIIYARSSCSTDQFFRMIKYERIVSVGKKMTPLSLSQSYQSENVGGLQNRSPIQKADKIRKPQNTKRRSRWSFASGWADAAPTVALRMQPSA